MPHTEGALEYGTLSQMHRPGLAAEGIKVILTYRREGGREREMTDALCRVY